MNKLNIDNLWYASQIHVLCKLIFTLHFIQFRWKVNAIKLLVLEWVLALGMFTYSVLMGNRTIITMSGLHVNTNDMSLLLHQSVTLDPQALEFVIIMPIILYLQTHINVFCGVLINFPGYCGHTCTCAFTCTYMYIITGIL